MLNHSELEDAEKKMKTEKSWSLENISKENGVLTAHLECYDNNGEGSTMKMVPLTKKILIQTIKSYVPEISELEVLLGTKVEDFDNFMRACWLTGMRYGVAFCKYDDNQPNDPLYSLLDGSEEAIEEAVKDFYTKDKLFVAPKVEALEKKFQGVILTGEDFFDKIGLERMAKLFDDAEYRWGWESINIVDDAINEKHYQLESMDFITHSDKFKRAVVTEIMIDTFDWLTMGIGCNEYDRLFEHPITVEEAINLPEE